MKIGILLGSPKINGGTYVIYEHASRLKRKGHKVVLITKQEVAAEEHAWHSSARELEWLTLERAKNESFEIVLATWWQSPFLLHLIESAHYAYFVQSIETRFFEPLRSADFSTANNFLWQDLCEKSYSYKMPMITEACWIREYLYNNWNSWPYLVRNGIRKDIYAAAGKTVAPRRPGHFRVLVEGPTHVSYKNVPAALRLARQGGADEVWLLTSSDIIDHPDADRVFSQIPIHETPTIYRSCDLILKLSYVEGMFGPPLEMFHCGGTALVYDVTGHDEYIVHDENAYVVSKDDEDQVVRLLQFLKKNPVELERLKQGAAATATAWPDWEVCSDQFEQTLLKIVAERPVSRDYLRQYTEVLHSLLDPLNKARAQNFFAEREKATWEGSETCLDNFVQLYWTGEENFTAKKSQWRHYQSGAWTECAFTLRIEELPLWLRLDPSYRIGITELDCITVRNVSQDREIMAFREQEELQQLFLAKDLKWLCPEHGKILFTYGTEPIILLPTVKEDNAQFGDLLEISIRLREDGMQRLNVLASTADDDRKDNKMLLYWDGQGRFSIGKSKVHHYSRGERTAVAFSLPVEETPLWLRLDPSCRAGFIEIASLAVRNVTRNTDIMVFREPDDFERLFLTGSLTWLAPERRNILLSGGPNAICVLPKIEQEQIALGDMLEITVRLRESSPQEFAALHHVRIAELNSGPWWKKLLRGAGRRLGLTKN